MGTKLRFILSEQKIGVRASCATGGPSIMNGGRTGDDRAMLHLHSKHAGKYWTDTQIIFCDKAEILH